MDEKQDPVQGDQVLAAIAHASAIFALFGPLIPALVWLIRHKKSSYVAFHSLQAMGYQILSIWAWATVMPILIIAWPVLVIIPAASEGNAGLVDAALPLTMAGMWGLILASYILLLGIALAGAIGCITGRQFYYPFLGRRLAGYLSYAPGGGKGLAEDRTDGYLAAICHSTAILSLWGILFPLVIWLTQKERSAWLRYQSMQAALFQALGTLCSLFGSALYLLSFVWTMTFIFISSDSGSAEAQMPAMAALVFSHLCMILLILLISPLYYCLASWAAYRILRGHDYRYPLLGGILARRMALQEKARIQAG